MANSPTSSVYLQLGRKTRPSSKRAARPGQMTTEGNVLVEEHSALPAHTPYEFFYPQEAALSPQARIRSMSPELLGRAELRKRRKHFFEQRKENFHKFEKDSNLAIVHKAFMQYVSDEGMLTRQDFYKALSSLNVTDVELMERVFDLFDGSKESIVEYEEVITAIDVIVNGTNRHITASDCFALVDPTGCGYVIMNCLQELKHKRAESEEVTHMMVKSILEIFERLQAEEEERRQKEKSKKGKKGKADNATPQVYAKKIHLNYDEFSSFLARDPALLQAFLSRILLTMEAVYFKNKKAVAMAGAAQVADEH